MTLPTMALPALALPALSLPERVRIVEVGPRDGLQNEAQSVRIEDKLALIDDLAAAGLTVIEAGAFVSPHWVPQMADSGDVLRRLQRRPGVAYPVLVPNLKGYALAKAAGAREIAVFAAASESFSQRNINCSITESLERFEPVCAAAQADGIALRGYVSCVLGCPYEGEVTPAAVAAVARRLQAMGCTEISLGDTIGTGTPLAAVRMVETVAEAVPMAQLAAHFHDTWGQALANLLAVMQRGIAVIDSAVAGLGGCPYAAGASGNVATEDVVTMLDGMGITCGVDRNRLAAAGARICAALGRKPASKAAQALLARGAAKPQCVPADQAARAEIGAPG